jgi:hypothetical protein
VDWLIAKAIGHDSFSVMSTQFPPGSRADKAIPHYTKSLDAAMTPAPEGLFLSVEQRRGGFSVHLNDPKRLRTYRTFAATEVCARLAAALRARAALKDGGGG